MDERTTDEPGRTPDAGQEEPLAAAARRLRSLVDRSSAGRTWRLERIAALKAEVLALEGEVKDLLKLEDAVQPALVSAEAGRAGETLRQLRRLGKLRSAIAETNPDAARLLDEAEQAVEQPANAAARELSTTFPAALAAVGLQPDQGSRFPRFLVRGAFVDVKIDVDKAEAVVLTRGGSRTRVGADAVPLASLVAELLREAFDPPVDRAAVLRRVCAAADAVDVVNGAIEISAAIKFMSESDEAFSADRFLVELEALVYGPQPVEPGAPVVRLDATRDTKRGVLLPGHEASGYKGYLRIEQGERADGNRPDQ